MIGIKGPVPGNMTNILVDDVIVNPGNGMFTRVTSIYQKCSDFFGNLPTAVYKYFKHFCQFSEFSHLYYGVASCF